MKSTKILDKIIEETKLSKKKTFKQQQVFEAAIKLFSEKGFANTSTSEIAKAAGVAEGTIFRHYGTKDNLLLAIILPFIKDLLPTMVHDLIEDMDTRTHGTFENFLRNLFENRTQFLKDNQELFQILIKELIYRKDLQEKIKTFFAPDFLIYFNNMLNKFKATGEIIDIPNPVLTKMILTQLISYNVLRFIIAPDYFVNSEVETNYLIEFVMNGIRNRS